MKESERKRPGRPRAIMEQSLGECFIDYNIYVACALLSKKEFFISV